jgi:hypothetical protein
MTNVGAGRRDHVGLFLFEWTGPSGQPSAKNFVSRDTFLSIKQSTDRVIGGKMSFFKTITTHPDARSGQIYHHCELTLQSPMGLALAELIQNKDPWPREVLRPLRATVSSILHRFAITGDRAKSAAFGLYFQSKYFDVSHSW